MATHMGDMRYGEGFEGSMGGAWTGALGTFYSGGRLPCPVGCGGVSQVVRVGAMACGRGELWLECGSCAQRGRYPVPEATERERQGIEEALKAGRDLICPRHLHRAILQRRGRGLVCPDCGVRYRE